MILIVHYITFDRNFPSAYGHSNIILPIKFVRLDSDAWKSHLPVSDLSSQSKGIGSLEPLFAKR